MELESNHALKITFLGGTGRLGKVLLTRFARAGFRTFLASRLLSHGEETARKINNQIIPKYAIQACSYSEGVMQGDIIFMTIPYPASTAIAQSLNELLQHKLLVDTTVPVTTKGRLVYESAVAKTQKFLGEHVRVVSAFQTISATLLAQEQSAIDSNVLVTGNDLLACDRVINLAHFIGLKGVYCGNLDHSLTTENLAITLMQINRHHHTSTAGVNLLL
ncbi:MAG: NAD(P)-binding domain-containing protein [Legionellaceae bacterium]|nr:NAD(P)-binding domain-containing protein [Legionellaceae bacterium]